MQEKIKELKEKIAYYDDLYYNKGISEISDAEYDRLYKEYEEFEKSLKLNDSDSPTKRVGAKELSSSGLPKFTHKTPLLSIDRKAKEISELKDFYEKCGGDGTAVIIEPKLDGITCNVNYENCTFVNAATRGNGYIGDLITENFKNTGTKYPVNISHNTQEVRGEAIIPYTFFKENLESEYSNPRNAVAGIMRSINPADVSGKGIQVMFYDIGTNELECDNDVKQVESLKREGFQSVPYVVCRNLEEVLSCVETSFNGMIKQINGFNVLTADGYPDAVCDGLVIKVDDLKLREEIGFSEKGPKWAFAYKFKPLQEETVIRDVEWQVGKSGRITPVAVFDEISLGGTKITKATLNNYDYMSNLPFVSKSHEFIDLTTAIRKDDLILVERSNDVIPRVVGVVAHMMDKENIFLPPDKCPVCHSLISQHGPLHYCSNPLCKAQMKKKLEHFASRNAMNIVGLGESIVDLFFEEGLISTYSDIYDLKNYRGKITAFEKFGDKKVDNILDSIEKSKDVELPNFISSLSIPNVGRKTAKDLAIYYKDIESLLNCKKEELLSIEDISDIIANDIYECTHTDSIRDEIHKLLDKGLRIKSADNTSDKLKGKTFVITGTLSSPREYYQNIIESNGGKVSGSVSKKTYAVFIGENAGSKEAKAYNLIASGADIRIFKGEEADNFIESLFEAENPKEASKIACDKVSGFDFWATEEC